MPVKPPVTIRELFINGLYYHAIFMVLFTLLAVENAIDGSWWAIMWFVFLVVTVVEFFRILQAYREFKHFRKQMEGALDK